MGRRKLGHLTPVPGPVRTTETPIYDDLLRTMPLGDDLLERLQ